MGAARSRSHRAGGRPSTRTRTLLLHAVRVAVAAEARGGPRQGAHTFVFGVTRLTPPGRPTERPPRPRVKRPDAVEVNRRDASVKVKRPDASVGVNRRDASVKVKRPDASRRGKTEFHSCEILGLSGCEISARAVAC